jgi:PAS domain S-box-containing protein
MKEVIREDAVENNDVPTTLVNKDGLIVDANEAAVDQYGYPKEELLEMTVMDAVCKPTIEHGRMLAEAIQGDKDPEVVEMIHGDGYPMDVRVVPESTTIDGEKYVLCETEVLSSSEEKQTRCIDDLSDIEVQEISENIRITTESGTRPLNQIIWDIGEMHNEIEQARIASYELYRAIDDRLEEEQCVNGENNNCRVLRNVRESVRRLIERVER